MKNILIFIMSEVIIITIIFIVSISLYPLNERNLNNYIEKQYGIINDYIETDGSYVYSYNNQNGEKCTLVFNRNFWVKDRFKVGENTNDKKFDISNQYEYLEILNEDSLKVDILKRIREEKINRYALDFFASNFSIIAFLLNRKNNAKSRNNKHKDVSC